MTDELNDDAGVRNIRTIADSNGLLAEDIHWILNTVDTGDRLTVKRRNDGGQTTLVSGLAYSDAYTACKHGPSVSINLFTGDPWHPVRAGGEILGRITYIQVQKPNGVRL